MRIKSSKLITAYLKSFCKRFPNFKQNNKTLNMYRATFKFLKQLNGSLNYLDEMNSHFYVCPNSWFILVI